MGLLDPTASAESVDRKSLSSRVKDVSGKRVGLVGNGKQSAEPILNVVEERLVDRHDDIEIGYYLVEELNMLKDEAERERIGDWAEENVDVAITAMGDCGSCTKFLVWVTDVIEESGIPAVGLLDQGFVTDWESNSIERGRSLRYQVMPVRCEVTDRDRIRENVTQDVIEGIESELTRPLDENEHEIVSAD